MWGFIILYNPSGVHSMMMLLVSSLSGNTRRHVTCLCEYVSMTTVNECPVTTRAWIALHWEPMSSSTDISWNMGCLFKKVTRTHYGIWSSHFSTWLCIWLYVYLCIYPATSVSPSGGGTSWPTLSVLKHYHVVQGNFPNTSYSSINANLKQDCHKLRYALIIAMIW